ncbi:MAG: hypothetical protein JSV77_08120 [Dehalococcoidales bacterium]|nr:MAG: hypothetical protein JSV77_08120 [Dehalococcoidales bacterium]
MMAGKWKTIGEGLAGASIMAISLVTPFLNRRRRYWGATDAEIQRALPGDDLVPDLKGEYVHAITINAPAADIWPWLVQIGQGRGGFYSYELLENMIGCKIKNADEIIPELQHLEVGDSIPMHPTMGSPYKVAAIEPDRALVLLLRADMQTGNTFDLTGKIPEKYQNSSWVLFLDERDDGTTRLVSRSRNDWNDSLGNTIFFGIFGNFTLEMDRKMLLGIKERVEAAATRFVTA